MKKIYSLLIVLLFISYSFAQVKPQTVTKSTVVFHIKNLGITIDGTFAGFKGDIKFDPANLAGSTIEASVDVNTIDTDNGTRNDHLKSDSYFDAAKYPTISMKSTAFKHGSGSNYTGTFSLTIKNVTKTIDVPFTYADTGNTTEFKGKFQIKRSDYGVGSSSLVMSDDVKVDLDVTTSK
ncbi:MAG TPA: YceI family protein [Mucilaginibacter sp.]|jgi:polyisoprenoid-binding protein YceI|nr:YceI family protein [Mucilaginibacter sp.]